MRMWWPGNLSPPAYLCVFQCRRIVCLNRLRIRIVSIDDPLRTDIAGQETLPKVAASHDGLAAPAGVTRGRYYGKSPPDSYSDNT